MEFLTDTRIDFLKYRKGFVWVSLALLVVAVVELFALGGLNLGIDFAGGTQMTVKLSDDMEIDELRQRLLDAGLTEVQIQRFGEAEANEVLLRMPVKEVEEEAAAEAAAADADEAATEAEAQEGSSEEIINALEAALGGGEAAADLNLQGSAVITETLMAADPEGLSAEGMDQMAVRAHYETLAEAIIEERTETGVLTSWEQVASAEGVGPAVVEALQARATLGSFSILSTENVGPTIGSELRTKGIAAMVMSLLGMLVYIWFRFELRFGVGALVAVFHDFLIVLGLFALMEYEFNLSTIAAFLTLIGYSVNDTVIIFDRVRENMAKHRRMQLIDQMNLSINQNLSRTVLTSGTTLLVVGTLFVYGGDVIRGFAFVLLTGIIIGTYSSVFVASPFALAWENYFGREAKQARAAKKSRA